MTSIDDLWFRTTEANQQAEQAYHRICDRYDDFLEFRNKRRVSRPRFRTLAERISKTGTPFGVHTLVYRPTGELLLVRHEGVDLWVLPGGEVMDGESYLDAAKRELAEEAGVEAMYEGVGIVTRIEVYCGEYSTWGVMPIFDARAETLTTEITDPDDEISRAGWFDDLPSDTRDRDHLIAWRDHRFR